MPGEEETTCKIVITNYFLIIYFMYTDLIILAIKLSTCFVYLVSVFLSSASAAKWHQYRKSIYL